MAEGPATQLQDVIIPEVFTPYTYLRTEEKSRLIQSGMLTRSPELDAALAGAGLTFKMPGFNDLDNDAERISTDDSVPFAGPYGSDGATVTLPAGQAFPPNPRKITTFTHTAVRLSRNNSWSSMDLVATLAGVDPMNVIGDRVADYWARRLQAAFVAMWRGVCRNNDASYGGDYTMDVSGSAFVDGVTNFSAAAFLDAAQTMGDSQNYLTGMMVHSVIYNRMQKNNLIDFIPDSEGRVNIPVFLGHQVVIDDGMPRNGNVYETWLFGEGASVMGRGSAKVPTEVDRKPGGGNGGGQDVLYSRVEWSLHPVGHGFVGINIPEGGPANTGTAGPDLDEATSWGRAFRERKMIKFARLITREA